jgi:hypothetical protein
VCLACGSKINGSTCDKCGSHMKKGEFKWAQDKFLKSGYSK